MNTKIHILQLEDDAADAKLINAKLESAAIEAHLFRVQSREEFEKALQTEKYDLILADYNLPGYDGISALEYARKSFPEIPFIFVSGAIGEDAAIEGLTKGATDYVLKQKLIRLVPAVKRALKEAEAKREKKLAEKALLESENRYRRITESLTDYQYSVRIIDGKAVETIQSAACESVTGYTSEEFAFDPFLWYKMIVPEDREQVREQVRRILSGMDIQPLEHRITRKDGTIRWVSDTTILFKDKTGKLISYDGVIKDITDRKRVEEELRTSEERFSKIFRLSPVAIAIFRFSDGQIIDANDNFVRETGYTREEVIGHTSDELNIFAFPEEKTRILQILEEKGSIEDYEFQALNKNGDLHYGIQTGISITLGGEKHYLSIIQDITERKKAEIELRKLSRAVEQSPVSIIITDLNGKIEYVNAKFSEATGYSASEVIGQNPRLLKSGEMSTENYKQLWEIIISGKEWFGEFHNKKKNGELFWERASISPILDSRGTITHFLAIKEDITYRKKSEKALLESERKYRVVADNTFNWEFWSDPSGSFIYCSPSCERVSGYSAAEFIQNPDLQLDILEPTFRPLFENHLKENSNNRETSKIQYKIIHKNGMERWIEHICQPVFDADGLFLGRRGSNCDISDKKETERKILNAIISTEESERNKFSQELHDGLGPMLSTVKLYFQWLSETVDSTKRITITETGLQNIDDAIQTLKEISNNLSPRILNSLGLVPAIKYLIHRINKTQKLTIHFNHDAEKRYNPQLEVTLYRILSELLNNTIKYASAHQIKINLSHNNLKKHIRMTYAEDGKGFDFHKVMEDKKGMGLYNMIQRVATFNGNINFDTKEGGHLMVRIELPLNSDFSG